MNNIKESHTVWHYVIWAPHTFLATIIFLFVFGTFVFVTYTRTNGRDRIGDESGILLALLLAVGAFLIYWIPSALNAYAELRLFRRRQERIDQKWETLRAAGNGDSEPGTGGNAI